MFGNMFPWIFFFHILEKSENINLVFQSFLKKDENYFLKKLESMRE